MRRRYDREATDAPLETVLDTLADEDCRALIGEMDVPRNASDLSERSDVPVSTAYRKLDRLDEASLVDEEIEIREDGRHTSRYRPDFDRVVVSLTEELDFDIEIVRPPRTTDERLEHLWTEVRRGV